MQKTVAIPLDVLESVDTTHLSPNTQKEQSNFLNAYGVIVDEDYEPLFNEEVVRFNYKDYAVSPSFSSWNEEEMRIFRSLL